MKFYTTELKKAGYGRYYKKRYTVTAADVETARNEFFKLGLIRTINQIYY